jgi:hypothetical protein
MNIQGYLRWQFQGSLSSPSFYGFALTLLALVAMTTGCPMPWPAVMSITGLVLVLGDAVRSWFRFSYSIYEMEQKQILRELERKQS